MANPINYYNQYPYTDYQKINLDWLMEQDKQQDESIASLNTRVTALEEGGTSTDQELFFCIYGTTTNAEIEAALTNNKLPVMLYNGFFYTISSRISATQHVFFAGDEVQTREVTVSSDIWSATVTDLAPTDSPIFTGTPVAPTPAYEDNSTKIATTAFVKTQVDELESSFNLISPTRRNARIDLSVTPVDVTNFITPSNYDCYVIPCAEGDVFTVTACSLNAPCYGFIEADGTPIYVSGKYWYVNETDLTAPANSAYLVIDDSSGTGSVYRGIPKNVMNDRAALNALYPLTDVDFSKFMGHKGKTCRQTTSGNYAPGSIAPSTNGYYSDLIPLENANYVFCHTSAGTGIAVITFYDETGVRISSVGGAGATVEADYSATVPAGAKYVRFGAIGTNFDIPTITTCYIGVRPNQTLDTAVKNNGAIKVDADLNDLTEVGYYLLYSGHTYTNAPPIYTSGRAWLINLVINQAMNQSGPFILQLFLWYHIWMERNQVTSGGVTSWSDWTIYDDKYRYLHGKKLSIVGDSISTYNGYNPPAYAYYYPTGDVNAVGKTWWKRVVDKCGMTLLKNASWSGSWVCYDSSGSVPDDSAKIAYTDARINELADGADTPDIIIVLIGTNDFIHDGGNAIGTLTENTELPSETPPITDFKPAYGVMINKIRNTYPDAHVYCCTLIQRYRSTDTAYPIKNGNGDSLALYNNSIVDVAHWMGCHIIRLDTAISLGQIPSYTVDGSLHPNSAGMEVIANTVIQSLVLHEKEWI